MATGITFRVNLETTNLLDSKNPYSSNDPQGANFKLTRSTWFPDFLRDNRALKHGATFTVTGEQALYLLNNFTFGHGTNSPYAFLDYVSGSAEV